MGKENPKHYTVVCTRENKLEPLFEELWKWSLSGVVVTDREASRDLYKWWKYLYKCRVRGLF